jgi:hypothetical protein
MAFLLKITGTSLGWIGLITAATSWGSQDRLGLTAAVTPDRPDSPEKLGIGGGLPTQRSSVQASKQPNQENNGQGNSDQPKQQTTSHVRSP